MKLIKSMKIWTCITYGAAADEAGTHSVWTPRRWCWPNFFLKRKKKGDHAAQSHCRSQGLSDEPSQASVGAVLGPQHMAPRPSSSNIPPRRCCWPSFFLKRKKNGDPAAQLHCRSQGLSDEPSGTRVACVDVGITGKSVLRRMWSKVSWSIYYSTW